MLFASYSPRCYFFIKSKRCDNFMIAVHKPVRESTVTTTLKFDNGCCCCVAHLISHRIIYVDNCGIFVVYYESAVARNCVILSPSWNRKHCHISYLWMTRLHLPSQQTAAAAAHPLDRMLTVKTSTACGCVYVSAAGWGEIGKLCDRTE